MASQRHQRINTQVQRSLGKCVLDKAVGNRCKSKQPHTQRRQRPAQLLPVPEPALVFNNTGPIMLRHFAGGTLHPALVFIECDHSGGSEGQFGGSPIRTTAAERAMCLNYKGGSAAQT